MDEVFDIGHRSWLKDMLPIQQDAFREGFESGRNSQFQQGFDEGYTVGFENGFRMGLVNGALRVAEELELVEDKLSGIEPFKKPYRGYCALCPVESDISMKAKMAEISLDLSLEELLSKQEKNNVPNQTIEAITSLLNI